MLIRPQPAVIPTFGGTTLKGNRVALGLPVILLFALPLVASVLFALGGLLDANGWASLLAHPQLWPALQLSLLTGLASCSLSVLLALLIVSGLYATKRWTQLTSQVGAMLAVPHLAMAIGISFLVMPSGFLARGLALFTGWTVPPNWITTHDPYGILLIISLVIKETPFFIWVLASILNREDVQRNLSGQRAAATSLGHDIQSIWLRIFIPQLLPKLIWPLLVVFVYAATVVDMALVLGPTQPPTFAMIVWADINDATVTNNSRGSVGAIFLSLAVAIVAILMWGAAALFAKRRNWLTAGPAAQKYNVPSISVAKHYALMVLYIIVVATILLLSFATLWPFPYLWPQSLTDAAWQRVLDNPSAILTSLVLAISTAAIALAVVIAWMESQPQSRDKILLLLSATALGLPAIFLSLGQYRALLHLGLTGTATGLFLAHLVPVTAYMFIVLQGTYRSFDPRWRSSASGLLASFPRYFWRVKLPLLKAPLLAASAIGFAVSFSQYVPAQLIAAGRFSTLPMEAVTLTSGTNRPLTAAFTLLLMVPPLVAFLCAGIFGKSRWRNA